MKASTALFVCAVCLLLGLAYGYQVGKDPLTHKSLCSAKAETAAISQRAAQICSTELVGCSLTFDQVKQVLAEQEAAKGCE